MQHLFVYQDLHVFDINFQCHIKKSPIPKLHLSKVVKNEVVYIKFWMFLAKGLKRTKQVNR